MTYEDQDEKFDVSTFTVPQYFNGTFQLPNLVFTEELSNLNSSESQVLIADVEEKVSISNDVFNTFLLIGYNIVYSNIYELYGDKHRIVFCRLRTVLLLQVSF